MNFTEKLLMYSNKISFIKNKIKERLTEINELQLKIIETIPLEIIDDLEIPFAEKERTGTEYNLLFTYDDYYEQKNIIENKIEEFEDYHIYKVEKVKDLIKEAISKKFETYLQIYSKSFSPKEAYEMRKEMLKDLKEIL